MDEKIEGFILSETDYSQNSKILNIITREYGVIGVIAKGCKKINSPIRSVSQKLLHANFYIRYKKDKLSILIGADVINIYKNIRNDILKISYLSYIADITQQVCKEEKNEEIYDIFIASTIKLEKNLSPEVLSNIIEVKYLNFLGVDIDLNKEYNEENFLNLKEIKLLKIYQVVDIKSIGKIDVDKISSEKINKFLKNYYENYTGIYIHSKSNIEKILKNLNI